MMKVGVRFSFLLGLIVVVGLLTSANASAFEGSLGFGPFLPSRIGGVREVMNGWGARFGMPTAKGFFEIEYYNAHGEGVNYHTVAFDYRLDVVGEDAMATLPVFLRLGLHADSFQPVGQLDYRTSGGWHYGGGFRVPLGDPGGGFALRAEFIQRFSPGNSLIVLVGFSFMTGREASGKP